MSKPGEYRWLRPGESVPAGEPWRSHETRRPCYVMLTWRIGPGQYVQTHEHRVKSGVVTEPRRPAYTRDAVTAALAAQPDLTLQELADVFKVSKATMKYAVEKFGLRCRPGSSGPPRPVTRSDEDIVAVYLAHGTAKAAEWAGRSDSAVQLRARRAGVAGQGRLAGRNPDDCGVCPRCRPRPRPVALVARTAVDDSDPVDDVYAREAAKYRRRAARRLQAALRRAATRPAPAPLGLPVTDPEWKSHAACRGLDPALFYASYDGCGRASMPAERLNLARLICGSCPVRDTCGQAVAAVPAKDQQQGIWGGRYVAVGAPKIHQEAA